MVPGAAARVLAEGKNPVEDRKLDFFVVGLMSMLTVFLRLPQP